MFKLVLLPVSGQPVYFPAFFDKVAMGVSIIGILFIKKFEFSK